VRRVLYRLRELLAGLVAGDPIWVVEGEKDVNRLHTQGYVATCNAGGAGKWRPEYAEVFRVCVSEVRIIADRDAPGYRHAIDVAASLRRVGANVRVFEAAIGKDVSDHLDAGRTIEELIEIGPEERLRELRSGNDSADSVDCVTDSGDWENPVEFGAEEFGPSVPLEAFPKPLADYIGTLAKSHQVAADLIAGAVLGMAAAAAAGRAEVAIGNTHVEPLNLYLAPVAPPGERKRVIRETTFPLEDEERRLVEAAAPGIVAAKVQRAIAEKRIKYLEETAAKDKDAGKRDQAQREALEGVKICRSSHLSPDSCWTMPHPNTWQRPSPSSRAASQSYPKRQGHSLR
jgi:hypothetical protein